MIFSCKHRRVGFPIGKRPIQRCHDCGRYRLYDWNRFEAVGPWLVEAPEPTVNPAQVYDRNFLRDLHIRKD